jgi:hypothetical protein
MDDGSEEGCNGEGTRWGTIGNGGKDEGRRRQEEGKVRGANRTNGEKGKEREVDEV